MSETDKKLWENTLKNGEKLLWTGRPQETGIVDPANKAITYIEYILAVVWVAVTLAMFGAKANGFFAIFIMELPAIILALIPWLDQRTIKGSVYAITDRRVIVKNGNDDYFMEYDSHTKVERRSNDTICIGAATDIKASQERHYLLFHGVQDDAKNCIGIVLYTTTDADGAMKILH
ncbi:MAG: hypothetical protein IJU30_03970 [Lachnospiraceae bacterium]|nr:hypothetical protein [Lachnospiraceae bacterium]